MKKKMMCILLLLSVCRRAIADDAVVWDLRAPDGKILSQIAIEPSLGDEYITESNQYFAIVEIQGYTAYTEYRGRVELPATDWLNQSDEATPVISLQHRIGIYCTHSDESYEPSDGYYSTRDRGSIYQVAQGLAYAFRNKGIDAAVAQQLHHPHDAGAYRRSRQTAVQLLKTTQPDCLIDLHRDGIPDPASYTATIRGQEVSKIRLLVGRGNQNAAVNKEFALLIKAIADQLYPGLIKDIYLGKGTFNQDLLPNSILLECGTYTLEKERVLASIPMIADVFDRALYGEVNHSLNDPGIPNKDDKMYAEPQIGASEGDGLGFLGMILGLGVVGLAILSAGSWKKGVRKAARNLSEMTGGLIGRKPQKDEDPPHS